MKPLTFLDTGAIYALADPRNHDHAAVRAVYNDPERTFILHKLILVEAFSLLTKRLHKRAALHLVGALPSSQKVEVVAVGKNLLEAGALLADGGVHAARGVGMITCRGGSSGRSLRSRFRADP